MSKIHIRPLEPGDRPAWDQLWAQYLEYYEAELTDEMSDLTWNRALNGDRIYGLIAFDAEKAVGMTHYLFHPSTWSESDVCYLEDLVVDSEYRGKSIGRALIEAVYAAADDAGCPDVYWLTQHFNSVGRRLYDRVGQLTPFIRYDRPD